jgi:alpha-L-arabinofuranosidase
VFPHADGWQWTPDLIWFDNLRSYGTPNYYVQKLFSTNKGTNILRILQDNKPVTGQNGIYATAAWDKKTNEIIIKIVNSSEKSFSNEINLEGSGKLSSKGNWTVLKSDKSDAMNSLDNPKQVFPEERSLEVKGKRISLTIDPKSLNILRIKSAQ